jgi:DNA-binding transcriptional LysR family regulator
LANLRNVDLNLLVTLRALLTERNVTRAAERLHLSQPSVSVQLGKLRRIFADPLLIAGPRGMLPTRRAVELLGPLQDALAGVDRVLQPSAPFDPARAQLTWHIAAADYAEYTIVLPVLPRLRTLAPGVRIAVHQMTPARLLKQLETGAIDLAFATTDEVPQHLRGHVLFRERYVLAARKGHSALKRRLTPGGFADLDYVLVSPDGGGFRGVTDTILDALGKKRRVVLSVPHFLFVPEVLQRSDLVAMLPSRLVARRARHLQVREAPINIPGYEMAMVWHERSHLDAAHSWLREQIVSQTREAFDGESRPSA